MKHVPLICLLLLSPGIFSQTCDEKNTAFSTGESLTYEVYYNWGFIWADAGYVTFRCDTGSLKDKKCWHFNGTGGTHPGYDWFYRVRDKYESWVDTSSFKAMRFKRDVSEGGHYIFDDYYFNYSKKKVYTVSKRGNYITKLDSAKITSCTFDVQTIIYYARCIDFSKYRPNDTIPFDLFLDGKLEHVYIRYLGKEIFDSKETGKYNCINFKPLLIEGSIFSGGENMMVWVTDDKNKIPVYVESPITVGAIKVYLKKTSGVRNQMSAKME